MNLVCFVRFGFNALWIVYGFGYVLFVYCLRLYWVCCICLLLVILFGYVIGVTFLLLSLVGFDVGSIVVRFGL